MAQGRTSPAPPAWLGALSRPAVVLEWDLAEWQRVIRLMRRLRLLGRLAEVVDGASLMEAVPGPAARHLLAELRYSRWRTRALVWALDRIPAMLGETSYPLVLLKGSAYIGQDLSIAKGRLPSDIDVLVPQAHVADAQRRLISAGWNELPLDEHDRRYYREWSHEVPPMRHPMHGLELDLHHNILPPVAHLHVEAGLLLARLQPSKWPRWQVLHPTDQVLHSAAHLFEDSLVRDRLRDLVDLDGLLRHFAQRPSFWDELANRARELGLGEPLALACHFTDRWLQTPVPDAIRRQIMDDGLSRWRRAWLCRLFDSALTPTEPDRAPQASQKLAAQLVLARYHVRRMPLNLLLPHVWHKALRATASGAPARPA